MSANTPQPDWAEQAAMDFLKTIEQSPAVRISRPLNIDPLSALIRQAAANRYLPELRMAEEALGKLKADAQTTLDQYDRNGPTWTSRESLNEYYSASYVLDGAREVISECSAALARIQSLTHPKPSPHEQIT